MFMRKSCIFLEHRLDQCGQHSAFSRLLMRAMISSEIVFFAETISKRTSVAALLFLLYQQMQCFHWRISVPLAITLS